MTDSGSSSDEFVLEAETVSSSCSENLESAETSSSASSGTAASAPGPTPLPEPAVPFTQTPEFDHRIAGVALVVAHHYKILRDKVIRDKIGGKCTPLTADEAKMADYLADTIAGMVGKTLGQYCRERFQTGWMTMDLRSYKIKFVLTKLRDMLPKGKTQKTLAEHLDDYVGVAEVLGGCVACDKRRNKTALAEAAKKRERKAAERAKKRAALEAQKGPKVVQGELFAPEEVCSDSSSFVQDDLFQVKETKVPKTRRVKQPKKSKFERMIDEIAAREYGQEDTADSFQDDWRDHIQDCEEYARSRNDDDFEDLGPIGAPDLSDY